MIYGNMPTKCTVSFSPPGKSKTFYKESCQMQKSLSTGGNYTATDIKPLSWRTNRIVSDIVLTHYQTYRRASKALIRPGPSWEVRPLEPTDPKSKTLIDVGPTEYRTKELNNVPQTDEDTISSDIT